MGEGAELPVGRTDLQLRGMGRKLGDFAVGERAGMSVEREHLQLCGHGRAFGTATVGEGGGVSVGQAFVFAAGGEKH